MKKPMKAALLSAFVYPGVGHYFLKKYYRFAALFIAFSIPLYLLLSDIFQLAQQIVDQLNRGEIALNIAAISAALHNQLAMAKNYDVTIYLLIVIWLIGILDAYRVGRTIDSA